MTIILMIVLLVVGFVIFKSLSKPALPEKSIALSGKASASKTESKKPYNEEWLHKRWDLAFDQESTRANGVFPKWFYDEVTDKQLARLKSMQVSVSNITKGQASDIIGLYEPAAPETLEILKFFNASEPGIKQSKAIHKVAVLMVNKENIEKWNSRPTNALQKEFYSFFGINLTKDTTYKEADMLIEQKISLLAETDDKKLEEWEDYEQIIEILSDPELREEYGIKKPSIKLIRDSVAELVNEGSSFRTLHDGLEVVVNKLIENKPALKRTS